MSAHKLLFQPKESGLVFLRGSRNAHETISFGGAYLAKPNIGVLGSHGAVANPLLATLMALGRNGLSKRITHCLKSAEEFAVFVDRCDDLELFQYPLTGVVNWRPVKRSVESMFSALPSGSTSMTNLGNKKWLRNVAANPNLDVGAFMHSVKSVLT